jgi:hypothetical protein
MRCRRVTPPSRKRGVTLHGDKSPTNHHTTHHPTACQLQVAHQQQHTQLHHPAQASVTLRHISYKQLQCSAAEHPPEKHTEHALKGCTRTAWAYVQHRTSCTPGPHVLFMMVQAWGLQGPAPSLTPAGP